MLTVAPLFSSGSVPAIARVALTLFTVITIFPWVKTLDYFIPNNGLAFVGLLVGEVLLGILTGFIVTLVYQIFQLSGELFATQMGFSASVVFDPLAQIEIPVLGQLFNLVAMFVFISVDGFQRLFLVNVFKSVEVLRASDLLTQPDFLSAKLIGTLGMIFEKSILISLPILGTLILVTMVLGLMGKAAPQMNLLMIGFPVSIGVGFAVMIVAMPFLTDAFVGVVDLGLNEVLDVMDKISPPTRVGL